MFSKRCFRCREIKPSTEFHRAKRNSDGLATWCKGCYREYGVERWKLTRLAIAAHRPELNDGREHTLQEVADELGICRQSVLNIERKALRKVRDGLVAVYGEAELREAANMAGQSENNRPARPTRARQGRAGVAA